VWKRPRWLAVLLPIVVVWVSWTTAMTALDEFHLFEDKYFMTITMLFGAWPTHHLLPSRALLPLTHPLNSEHGGRRDVGGRVGGGLPRDDPLLQNQTLRGARCATSS
jgi:hypothetical protein